MRRRQRNWTEILDDPSLMFRVGRLIGANEMAVALLEREQGEIPQRVARVLEAASAWFMEDRNGSWTSRSELPPGAPDA